MSSDKMRTKKIVAKRFKITATGKFMRGKQGGRHLRSHKSNRQLRKYNVKGTVAKGFERMIQQFLPYG
jgi:large subunit ribosomal protein L35